MTLVELLMAMTIFTIVLTGAMSAMSSHRTLFRKTVDRMGALTTLRYALHTLERDIRTLGTNVVRTQPALVYAGEDVIAFNADHTSNVEHDVFAVHIDPDAPSGEVTALRFPIRLPRTGFLYPDTVYPTPAGTNSPAELLIFFFEPDTTTAVSDDFVLWRQINDRPPEIVAQALTRLRGRPFFQYFARVPGSTVSIDSVKSADLPIFHGIPIHSSPADSGAFAKADSIRAVRVSIGATNGRPGSEMRSVSSARMIDMPNGGLELMATCGDAPFLGVSLTAEYAPLVSGEPAVTLTWGQAVDESGGEKDVIRYVVWRRKVTGLGWGDPYVSIPAGTLIYIYTDTGVESSTSYEYAVAAQDCTPSLSSLSPPASVPIP